MLIDIPMEASVVRASWVGKIFFGDVYFDESDEYLKFRFQFLLSNI